MNNDNQNKALADYILQSERSARKGLAGAAECLGFALTTQPQAMVLCADCRARLFGDERRRGKCDPCMKGNFRLDRRERLRSVVPAEFRWADLSKLLIPPGHTSPVVMEQGREQARAWLASDAPLLTIVGPKTGSGKTTLAAAIALAMIDAGSEPAWVRANALSPEYPNEEDAKSALRAIQKRERLFVDGVGKDLGGASAESGVAAMRKPWMVDFLNGLHSIEGRRIVLTSDQTREQMEAAYGADAVRRIVTRTDRVHVIVLQRIATVRPAEF